MPAGAVGDTVILVHGLWMLGIKLGYLAWSLRRRGFIVVRFDYRSMRGRITDSARQFFGHVQAVDRGRVHLVGYSLGGIVVASMMKNHPTEKISRGALIGCLLPGSALARFVAGSSLGRLLLGSAALEGIVRNRPVLAQRAGVLVVAGIPPLGIGLALALPRRHDGTVSISKPLWTERPPSRPGATT
jgi:pimeloyl-ACP methyl ester carboxylesterase